MCLQDAEGKKREKAERLRYGRFFYRFPHGESGADVYDRMTIFEDHLIRDINAGAVEGGRVGGGTLEAQQRLATRRGALCWAGLVWAPAATT